MTNEISLRAIRESDLPIFFEQQLDLEATRMAAFSARDHDAFTAHWEKIMAEKTIVRAVTFRGEVAGNIVSWEQSGECRVGYWLGKRYWGKGIASAALSQFLELLKVRPLYARVAKHNIASIRVLQKCGFTISGEGKFPQADGEAGEEFILILGANNPMSAIITLERPDSADAISLITELEAHLEPLYPPENRHGYSVEKLIAQAVAFFVLRENGVPAGCGGIQLFGTEYGELKRMYVRPRFRGLGFGKLLLNHLADYARTQGVGLLRLETGIHQAAAIRLYERMGFHRIPPFGAYIAAPLSLCYEKRIS